VQTPVGCGDEAAARLAEQFWALMTTARDWSIDRGNLLIRFDGGETAVFGEVETAAAISVECRTVDPNNLDCVGTVDQGEWKR
jgi:hypothetical protein